AGPVAAGGQPCDYTTGPPSGDETRDPALGALINGGSGVEMAGPTATPAVRVWADSAFTYWQVFTADTLAGDRRRRAVAVEPMTCPPDAYRSGVGVVTLDPGDTWRGTWGFTPLE